MVIFGVAAHSCDKIAQVSRDFFAGTCDAAQRDAVDKSTSATDGQVNDLYNTLVGRCGRHEEDQCQSVLLRNIAQWRGLFWRQVGNNHPTNTIGLCGSTETCETIRPHRIIVTHQDEWHTTTGGHLTCNLHATVDSHATFQRNMHGVLDGCTIRQWIAKRHTQFNDISPTLSYRTYDLETLFCRRIAAHHVRDEHAAPLLLCLLKRTCNPGCWLV